MKILIVMLYTCIQEYYLWIMFLLYIPEIEGQATCIFPKRASGGTCVSIIHNNISNQSLTYVASNKVFYKFTSTSGPNSITFDQNVNARVLVVGGGGSGGTRHAGGGGAGALIYMNITFSAATTYTMTVGKGGAVVTPTSSEVVGNDGFQSQITYFSSGTIVAKEV